MNRAKMIGTTGMILLGLLVVGPHPSVKGAPPIQSEEGVKEEVDKEKEKEKKKTPEEEKKAKEEEEIKENVRDIRKRQANDEGSVRVRANIFNTNPPEGECTGADRTRSRLQEIGDEGGLIIKGDLKVQAQNQATVEKNEGSINNQTSINITNEIKKRC